MHGTWKKGPGTELFAALEKARLSSGLMRTPACNQLAAICSLLGGRALSRALDPSFSPAGGLSGKPVRMTGSVSRAHQQQALAAPPRLREAPC